MPIASVNPTTGETLKTFDPLTEQQVDEKLQLASVTSHSYRWTSIEEREPMMMHSAEILEAEKHELGRLMTLSRSRPRSRKSKSVPGSVAIMPRMLGDISRTRSYRQMRPKASFDFSHSDRCWP